MLRAEPRLARRAGRGRARGAARAPRPRRERVEPRRARRALDGRCGRDRRLRLRLRRDRRRWRRRPRRPALPRRARFRRRVRPRVGRPRRAPLRLREPRLRRDGRRVRRRSPARRASRSVGARRSSLTVELVRAPRTASSASSRALRDAGRWLGIALASTFNLLDLEAVVLGGCFGPLSPWLVDEVRADARGALARGALGVVRRRSRRRSATAQPSAAPRRCSLTPRARRTVGGRRRLCSTESRQWRHAHEREPGRGKEVAIGTSLVSSRRRLNGCAGPSSVPRWRHRRNKGGNGVKKFIVALLVTALAWGSRSAALPRKREVHGDDRGHLRPAARPEVVGPLGDAGSAGARRGVQEGEGHVRDQQRRR